MLKMYVQKGSQKMKPVRNKKKILEISLTIEV